MNIKQKSIEAMYDAHKRLPEDAGTQDEYFGALLNAALAVLADPENWDRAFLDDHDPETVDGIFVGIDHVKGLPT